MSDYCVTSESNGMRDNQTTYNVVYSLGYLHNVRTQQGALEMMTATARTMSLENEHLRNCDYFAIMPSCSHFTMLTKNGTTGLAYAPSN